MWCITLIDLWVLNHPCIPWINPTWSWCMILLMCCWILFVNIFLRIFESMFIRDIGLQFSFLVVFFFFFFESFFIYLFLAVLGLRFCVRAFSSCGKRGPLFITVWGPLTIAASLAAEHRLQMRRLSNCGSRAQLLRGMWDLPRPGLEPVSPALAGRLSTTAPPGKPSCGILVWSDWPITWSCADLI